MKITTDKEEIHLGPVANALAIILATPAMAVAGLMLLVMMCMMIIMIPLLLPTLVVFGLFGEKVPITKENENNFSEEETQDED